MAAGPRRRSRPTTCTRRGHSSEEPAAGEAAGHFDYDPANPVPPRRGALLMTAEFPAGPRDQRRIEARPDVLVYTTSRAGADIEVTGPVTVQHLAFLVGAGYGLVVVRLCDVLPGRDLVQPDRRHPARPLPRRRPWRAAVACSPRAKRYEFGVDLWSTSNVFLKGHRIRVHVTSCSFPRWDRNPNTGHEPFADAELAIAHQTVLHDQAHPSRILLPVVPPS